jgi:hypothetical protein
VKVITTDPKKSAKIANSVTQSFLELRLKNKNKKADQTLDYISLKLGEARVVMETSITDVELYTIENNILSAQEFFAQSKRLREFRLSIKAKEIEIAQLEDQKNYFETPSISDENLKTNLDFSYGMAPRLRPRSMTFNTNKTRDLDQELLELKQNLIAEIERLEKKLAFTIIGFEKLEIEAKKTASNVRKLDTLKREVAVRTAAYDALLAQFETQTITDGYQEALGEIYQTATPAIVRSSPNKKFILSLSIVIGLVFGIALSILNSLASGRIWHVSRIKHFFKDGSSISVSKKFDNLKLLKILFNPKKQGMPELHELIALQGFCVKIHDFQSVDKNKAIVLTCAAIGKKSPIIVALSIAKLLANVNSKVALLDLTSSREASSNFIKKLSKNNHTILSEGFQLDEGIFYKKFEFNRALSSPKDLFDKLHEEKSNLLESHNTLITIVDYLESDTLSMNSLFSSDLFILIGKSGSFTVKQITSIKTSLGDRINKCLSFVFVKT